MFKLSGDCNDDAREGVVPVDEDLGLGLSSENLVSVNDGITVGNPKLEEYSVESVLPAPAG